MSVVALVLSESSIQLVPDGTLLLHLAVIVLLVALVNLTLLRPINRILEERERLTGGQLQKAHRAFAAAHAQLKRYEDALREARTEGYRLLELNRSEAMRQRERRINALKQELQALLAGEKAEIARQAEDARRSLILEAERIGLEISSHILGRETFELR
jgi:F-type H+-transporting ATPase subunit b